MTSLGANRALTSNLVLLPSLFALKTKRPRAVLSRVTTKHDIRIVKDTDTVQRIKIRYKTPVATGNLKI